MSTSRGKLLIVFVMASNRLEATRIAQAVVKEKLAACVNILSGVTSIFRWKGKIQRSREVLIMAKTTERQYRALEKLIRSLHSYEVPEIIAMNISKGLGQYTAWIEEETTRN